MVDVVILGTGQGAFQLGLSLREEGFTGSIVAAGDEAFLPYQRPPLSKAFLIGAACEEDVLLRPADFFAERNIEVRTGTRATFIDRNARQVLFADATAITYDQLVIATGARNRKLPVEGADLAGVVQLRDLAEAIAIRDRLPELKRVVVIGGGFIGLEFAACARAKGVDVTVIEAAARLMARVVSEPMSAFFRARHEAAGIGFRFGAGVARIFGEDGRVTGVETTAGEILTADLVLVGIGVVPNSELAEAAGLEVEGGIVVDEFLATSDPRIAALGDCVVAPNPYASGPLRIESVQNAVDQARCLAKRLTGDPQPYKGLPWFWSDQGGTKLQMAGLTCPHDEVVVRGDPGSGAFSVFCYRNGQWLGIESVNRVLDYTQARRLLTAGVQLSPLQAADTALDLKTVK